MTKLKIRGNVTERALELLNYEGDNSKVQCIRFGNTYYGTDRTECALLYNNGPEPVNFVAVVDEDAIAQELVRKTELIVSQYYHFLFLMFYLIQF